MQASRLLQILARSRVRLARRGHGGAAQTQKELERLALLEQSMAQPADLRAQQQPAVAQAAAANYLREEATRVGQLRSSTLPATPISEPRASGLSSGGEGAKYPLPEPQVSNLTQFLSACKRLRIDFSSESDARARRHGRERLCGFWAQHAASAVACCYQGVRDVGFVADLGLSDTGMHLDVPELWAMLRVLKAERSVASSVDATRILQYVARELQYVERQRGEDAPSASPSAPRTPDRVVALRHELADLAIDLLAFYFVEHSPLVNSGRQDAENARNDSGGTHAEAAAQGTPRHAAIASGIDALCGLEVLSVVAAGDASAEAVAMVWERRHVHSLRRQREPAVVAAANVFSSATPSHSAHAVSSAALAREVHHLLVAELFRFAAAQRRDLRLTDVIHGFSLLRVHLRTLWPPYDTSTGRGAAASAPAATAASPNSSPPSNIALWYEKDTLFRATWGLAVALVSKERKLISPYHYVKLVTTLAKLPSFVLSPEPIAKRELRRLELPSGADGAPQQSNRSHSHEQLAPELLSVLAETPPEQRMSSPLLVAYRDTNADKETTLKEKEPDGVALRPVDFWRFMVTKACIFVPGLPPDQRRLVCRSLHLAITAKRGHLLGQGGKRGPRGAFHAVPPGGRGGRSGFGRPSLSRRQTEGGAEGEGADDAASIVQPLVEEMAAAGDRYEACIQSSQPYSRAHHGRGGRGGTRGRQTRGQSRPTSRS